MGLGYKAAMHSSWFEGLDLGHFLAAVLPVWVLFVLIGWLLPRPKVVDQGVRSFLLFSSPPGTFFRRLALAFHGVVIVREVWFYFTCPGTFHSIVRALLSWVRGEGLHLPKYIIPRQASDAAKVPAAKQLVDEEDWYVTVKDLEFFKHRIDDSAEFPGTSGWSQLVDKQFEDTRYISWRRTLPNRKTEYKSVTITEDATAQEFQDFYLDDNCRPKWDTMIIEHEVLETGSPVDRRQVVRWVRSFPVKVLTDREYIIARRTWQEGGCLYGITKGVSHPRAAQEGKTVRVDSFYSMWRSRTIPCPKGTARPACETVLLHYEEMKVPENLARIAIRAGQNGFVKAMSQEVRTFVQTRRQRCDAFGTDAAAFGVAAQPDPPARLGRSQSDASSCSTASLSGTASTLSLSSLSSSAYGTGRVESASAHRSRRQQGQLVRLSIVALAAGLTMFAQPFGEDVSGRPRHRPAASHPHRHSRRRPRGAANGPGALAPAQPARDWLTAN